jgi:hypothetical protein
LQEEREPYPLMSGQARQPSTINRTTAVCHTSI